MINNDFLCEGKTMERIYLDYAATTPVDKRVLDAMMPYMTTEFGNPSSLHAFGQKARAAVQTARDCVAAAIGAEGREILFTAGGTEADNLALFGYLRANCPEGGHLITTAVEHAAVLRSFEFLRTKGYDVTVLPVNKEGRVSIESVKNALKDDTVLVSIMVANNETGTLQPIRAVGELLQEHGAVLHVDAVQGFGWTDTNVKRLHIDLLSVASHKIYGPKGAGALYIRDGIQLVPDLMGGPQERNLRAGTENVPALVGFGKACEFLQLEGKERIKHATCLKRYIVEQLGQRPDLYHLNGTLNDSLPNIINFSVARKDRTIVLISADRQGIALSAGSACESGAAQPSHVLEAMQTEAQWLTGSVRISLGKDTTESEVRRAVEVIRRIAGEK